MCSPISVIGLSSSTCGSDDTSVHMTWAESPGLRVKPLGAGAHLLRAQLDVALGKLLHDMLGRHLALWPLLPGLNVAVHDLSARRGCNASES